MRTVWLTVELQVEPCEAGGEYDRATDAATEAVRNALHAHETTGFVHHYADALSIHVVGVEPA